MDEESRYEDETSNKDFTNKNPNNKRKIIVILIITAIILGIITGLILDAKAKRKSKEQSISKPVSSANKKIESEMTEVQKEIIGAKEPERKSDISEIKEDNYSELYKEYLKREEKKEEKREDNSSEVIPRKQEVPIEKIEEIKKVIEKEDDKKIKKEIPEKFDLNDVIDIKVEDQMSYGLCWDFASIKSLETHLALNNKNMDLSEIHLDYIESNLMFGSREVHNGGNFDMFKDYLIDDGVVLEEKAPYYESVKYEYGYYHNPIEYSEEQYSKFTDIEKATEVTETIDFPSIYKSDNCQYTEEEINENRKLIKKHIMKNGGLYCVIATPDTGTKYYNSANAAECFLGEFEDLPSGREIHAVTIVGWDDNYPKENFNANMRPNSNGAYIVLNSWGESFGKQGYFYISYEDKYVENDLSGIVSTSMDSAYKLSLIKDANFRKYLKDNYGHMLINYKGEDYITKNVASKFYSLDLTDLNISSIEGIEIFSNVYSIYLSGNNIKDISPLTKMTSLSYIDLSNNKIEDVSSLVGLKSTNICSISLAGNRIKDVSELSKIPYEINISDDKYLVKNYYTLDLANNPGVVGYEKLDNVYSLDITGCGIKDLSNLKGKKYLRELNASNNPGITGMENLSDDLFLITMNNCALEKVPYVGKGITEITLINNNIIDLDGVERYKSLSFLNVSENKINSWTALEKIAFDNSYEEDDYYWGFELCADKCGIEDISFLNNVKNLYIASLKDNNIKDVSSFSNDNIYYINLSGNKGIKGLQGLKKVRTIFLNDCDLNDETEIIKLKDSVELSLERNGIKDISVFSDFKNMYILSLAGNKGMSGTLSNNNISDLNLSDCDIDNNFDFSNLKGAYCFNITKNPRFKDIYKISKNVQSEYMCLYTDKVKYEDYTKFMEQAKYVSFSADEIIMDYKLNDGETRIDLTKLEPLKKSLMKSYSNGLINVNNGRVLDGVKEIEIFDISKGSVEVKIGAWTSFLYGGKMIINFKEANPDMFSNEIDENTVTNSISNNTSLSQTNSVENKVVNIITNTISNTISNTTNTTEEDIVDNTIANTINNTISNTTSDIADETNTLNTNDTIDNN